MTDYETALRQNIAANGRAIVLSGMAGSGLCAMLRGEINDATLIGVFTGFLALCFAYLADTIALHAPNERVGLLYATCVVLTVVDWAAFAASAFTMGV